VEVHYVSNGMHVMTKSTKTPSCLQVFFFVEITLLTFSNLMTCWF